MDAAAQAVDPFHFLHDAIEAVVEQEIEEHDRTEKFTSRFQCTGNTLITTQTTEGGAQEIAKQTAQTAQAEIQKLKGAAREQGSAAVEEIKTAAQSVAREAQETGRDLIHKQKENVAQSMHKYAEALRAALESLRNEEGNVLAEPARKGQSNSNGCRATYARRNRVTLLRI